MKDPDKRLEYFCSDQTLELFAISILIFGISLRTILIFSSIVIREFSYSRLSLPKFQKKFVRMMIGP